VHDSYDELPFESKVSRTRHVDRLATVGTLLGVAVSPPHSATVLEIGCSTGGNLIPMALEFPDAHFVGIDLSPAQIAIGRDRVQRLGLRNLDLIAGDISTVELPHEAYDYIVCHGVFSWVPEAVRGAILSVVSRLLTLDGIACISFNCQPGWAIRGIVRRVLLRKDDPKNDVPRRVRQGREVLRNFQEALGHDRFYSLTLQKELERIQSESDSYLFHEFLERENEPFYLTNFVNLCASHELFYLGDARWGRNFYLRKDLLDLSEEALKGHHSWLDCEEYLDDVFNTGFREALLTKHLPRVPTMGSLDRCFMAAQIKRVGEGPLRLDAVEEFVDSRGRPHTASEPLEKIVLMNLAAAWPEAKPFELLKREVQHGMDFFRDERGEIGEALEGYLKTLLLRDIADASLTAPRVVREPKDDLLVSPWVAVQSSESSVVTNGWHDTVEIGDLERRLISGIGDGSSRAELEARLEREVHEGSLVIAEEGIPMSVSPERDENLKILITDGLTTLAQAGLLLPSVSPSQSEPTSQKESFMGKLRRKLLKQHE